MGLTTTPTVNAVSVNGGTNNPGDNIESVEVTLDIEIVGGICPNSYINVYFAPNTLSDLYDAIVRAILDGNSTISISWGFLETDVDSYNMEKFNTMFYAATTRGINIFCASGDTGSSNINFLATIPWAVGCGGTALTCPNMVYNSLSTTEVVWNNLPDGGASGGGYSTHFGIPDYQKGVSDNIYRGVPDISGDADPSTGWKIIFMGSTIQVGGTSAVAPMMAAYIAGIGFNKFLNPYLYTLPSGVHDIITGNNGAYQATKGWDPCTGMGTPNGSVLTPYLLSQL